MARITPVPDARLGWLVLRLKRFVRRKLRLDQDSESFNYLAHHRGVLWSQTLYMAGLDRWNRLPVRLKRLVHLRVAMRVGCPA